MHDDIFRSVTYNHDEASLLLLHSIANERWDARVSAEESNELLIICYEGLRGTYTALRTISYHFEVQQSLSKVIRDGDKGQIEWLIKKSAIANSKNHYRQTIFHHERPLLTGVSLASAYSSPTITKCGIDAPAIYAPLQMDTALTPVYLCRSQAHDTARV
jgi:hypothetical protein